jgi:predicted exporter
MSDRFIRWVHALHRKPVATLLATLICVLLAGAGWLNVRFEPSLACFFPPESRVARTLSFLTDAALADKIAVSFERVDDGADETDFLAFTDEFARRASSLPDISGVLATADSSAYLQDLERLFASAPQWLSREQLESLSNRLDDAGVKAALQRRYRQMVRPEGSFLETYVRYDPLGFFDERIAAFGSGALRWGYDIEIVNGRLMSRDGRHRLIVLDTDVPTANVSRSVRLLETLGSLLDKPSAGVKVDVVCGHAHSVSNQEVILSDLRRASLMSGIAFVALLLFFYRDWRIVSILLVPVFAVFVALPVCSLFFDRMTFLVAAFGPIIVGLTDDYCIHTYRAVRRGERDFHALLQPIWAGMSTTLVVFLAFFASRAEGYRQLACFGSLAILIAFLFAVFVLPHVVKMFASVKVLAVRETKLPFTVPRRRWAKGLGILAVLIVVSAGVGLSRIRLDTDFVHLDGARPAVWEAEKRFQSVWGQDDTAQALVAVRVADSNQVEEAGAELFNAVSERIGRDAANGLVAFFPSSNRRVANLRDWRAFWSQGGRAEALRAKLMTHGAAFGFADNAFAPFLRLLTAPSTDTSLGSFGPWMRALCDRYVRVSRDGGMYAVVYLPDQADVIAKLRSWLSSRPDVVCASRRMLSEELGELFSTDILRVIVLAVVLLFIAAWVTLRDLRHVVVVLLPVVVAEGLLFGVLGLFNVPINIVHLMASIVVLGVTFDYGVFVLHILLGYLDPQTWRDMQLCLLTTLAGAAPFLTAEHPVLFSLGLVLTGGVIVGYVVAVLFSQSVCRKLGLCSGLSNGNEGALK